MSDPVVIVGAGAAGLMAAAELAAAGRGVVLLERGDRPGRKILISGGGRCNLTHEGSPEALLAAFDRPTERFLKHAVYDLSPEALRAWLAERGLATVVETDGCVFPASHRSKEVLDKLLRAVKGGELRTGVACRRVLVEDGRAVGVETAAGRLAASAVILAAGGPAWPAAGGSASGCELLAALGHAIVKLRPGLAPLQIAEPWVRGLQGVSLEEVEFTLERLASARDGKRERVVTLGPVVFTHEGLSGPAALDLSSHLEKPTLVRLSLLPGRSAEEIESHLVAAAAGGSQLVRDVIGRMLPRRVIDHLLMVAGTAPNTQAGQLTRRAREHLAELLTAAPLTASVAGGWDQAMVSVGGCELSEVNSRTMESRKVAGLYVVGELLDIAGPTGGYNLHAAFATGRLAARAALAC